MQQPMNPMNGSRVPDYAGGVPIVLTATIIPNGIPTQHSDWRVRREQYLHAIDYYRQFSKVYFLDNSKYDLASDPEFQHNDGCVLLKYPGSDCSEKGKGYQEFEMLDAFVKSSSTEDCFVKITGRYIYSNFPRLFSLVCAMRHRYDLIIDSSMTRKKALTSLFYVKRSLYGSSFAGCYRQMDDRRGIWAEHVVYDAVRNVRAATFFPVTPVMACGGGRSTGEVFKWGIKDLQRYMLSALCAKRLLR